MSVMRGRILHMEDVMKVADRSDEEWKQLSSTFYGNNHGANGSRKQLTDLLVLAGVTPPEGMKYRELQQLFTEVRDEVSRRASTVLNHQIGVAFTKAMRGSPNVELDGLEVHLYRGEDGKLVVEIDSTSLDDKDQHPDAVPNIRIWINEQKIEIAPDGKLIES
jgi:hypothetical protein